jgi:CrcB protein
MPGEHREVGAILLVAVGGAVGTVLRIGVGAVLPEAGPLPAAVIVINLSGALLLGWLLEALRRPGPETPGAKAARLGLGTGVLGGYTTYSAFAVGTDALLMMSDPFAGLGVSLATVIGGVFAAWLGSLIPRLRRPRGGRK